jgi:predicted esterase
VKSTVNFSYEATYHLSHSPTGKEKEIWVVLHGYGQLAEFFLRKFAPFSNENRLILAPEGTNYSYLKEFQGRIGANWMTSYERELAIANNHRFLDQVMKNLLEHYFIPPKIHVLGFSQGAATATRWISHWPGQVSTLILWAGGFAHDLNLDLAREKFAKARLILVTGEQDELVTEEQIKKQEAFIRQLEVPITRLTFQGGHEIEGSLLEKILKQEI